MKIHNDKFNLPELASRLLVAPNIWYGSETYKIDIK